MNSALTDAAEALIVDLSARERAMKTVADADGFATSWRLVEEIGLPNLLVPEAAGGIGASFAEFLAIARQLGYHSLSLPLSESMLARYLAANRDTHLPPGPLGIGKVAQGLREHGGNPMHLTGKVERVPWGRFAQALVAEWHRPNGTTQLGLVECSAFSSVQMRDNSAGEPRDTIILDNAPVTLLASHIYPLLTLGALSRVGQMTGALERTLELCVRHVGVRSQFGRKLAEFQAIQQQVAVLAEEVAACSCAAAAAAARFSVGEACFEVAAAKQYANHAVTRSTAIAHQVHGAIGMTKECELQRLTRRLWSWQTEFGDERYWGEWLGAYVSRSEQGLWGILTSRGDEIGSEESRCDKR